MKIQPFYLIRRRFRRGSLSLLLALCLLLPGLSLTVRAEDGLTVRFLDVGQGLCVLLESQGHYALYDGGDRNHASRVVACLREAGVDSLDYVIASHYDADHLNGLVGALHAFPAVKVLGPDYASDTSVYDSFNQAVSGQGLDLEHPRPGTSYTLGDALFTVLAPLSDSYSDANNYSLVLKLCLGEDSFLLMGDAESQSEEELTASGQDLSCDVLCVGHHGSASSTTWDLLEQALPSWAVISCGLGNDYGHPHEETMEKLEALEIPVFRTDLQGDVSASTQGSGIIWSTDPCSDYSSGDLTAADAGDADSGLGPDAALTYVLNTNTGVFHRPSCRYVNRIKAENRVDFTGSRDELTAQGYAPCKVCQP